jgi:hypothetical protein
MKKWLWVTVAVIVAAFASVYIFIPAQLNIAQITTINCTANGAYRVLSNADKWQTWWPGVQNDSNTIHYKHGSFSITNKLRNTLEILIQQNDLMPTSVLHVFPATGDSSTLNWQCRISTGNNPFKRIQHYLQAVIIKSSIDSALSRFKTFAEKKENIYGISFRESIFKDSFVISSKLFLKDYPTVTTVYTALNALKKYSNAQQAKQTGYPLMTALPVNRQLPASGPFFNQRIPLNRFLVTRVRGGNAAVDNAIYQFQLYIQDYQRTVMALPFQQLVTDRSVEPDTSRWVTDIYFPLF